MDIGKAFTYAFEDPKIAAKLGFAALFTFASFLLVGIPFLLGYNLALIRNVHRGDAMPLPEWDNLGEKFMDGLKLLITVLVYALPAIVVYCCASIGGSVLASQSNSGVATAGALLSVAGSCIYFLLLIALLLLMPGVYVQYARTGDIAASLRVGDVVKIIQRNTGPYLITVLMIVVGNFIAQLGVILCFIGVLATLPYSYWLTSHLTGQLWAIDDAKAIA